MFTHSIITDLNEAKKIWEILSPHESLYDEWDFRHEYYKYFLYPIEFHVAYTNKEPVALLPLQYNTSEKLWEFFGGSFMEDNRIFIKNNDELLKKYLVDNLTKKSYLTWMKEPISGHTCTIIDYKYELQLENYNSIDDFLLKNFNSKRRNNLKNQIAQIMSNKVSIVNGSISEFELMVEMNKKRFKEESTFHYPHREDFFRDIIKKYKSELTTIFVNDNPEAVGLSIHFKESTIGLNSGTNITYNGLGKFLILQKINSAIQNGSKMYDARAGDLGWKESFNFNKRPQYMIEINK